MSADLGGAEGDVRKKQSGCGRVTSPASKLPVLLKPTQSQSDLADFLFPSESVSVLCADLVCPPCFADSAADAALMFNSSLFVLVHGNPGFPPGISPREADLVFAALSRCIKALQQHAGGCRRVIYLTSLV
ncbi:hypothetical protein D9C73_009026 [Collichthys lucidus]|uniref:Uncharacterized protein n=1 Tax=Collichthys lucidus TaxID=240159 RepID=A0A4U5UJK9_COLLU|nr:hypothetical protein D9C73_009026 [Collichthys lucidus]